MPHTGKEMLKLAKKHGWIMVRINGSHHIMVKEGHLPVSIPVHNKDLKIGQSKKY
ncbi:type II toxin-antitoxin system HicA family toxin [Enterococcus hulanensis]|uniref:type II toxin-antitoxin system HicA family toxin n=1 Tax=Enterococcus hulanensis TaxID=2559929 RepID=UPI0035E089D2